MSQLKKKIGASPEIKELAWQLSDFANQYHFNFEVLIPIVRHLMLIDSGTGYHEIKITIRNHNVVAIVGADTEVVNQPIKK